MRRFLWLAAFLTAIQTTAPTLLETGRPIEGQLATGGSDEFQVKLLAGQYAWVAVQQHTINVAIACFAPDGKEVLIIDGFQIGDAEHAEFIVEEPGTYTVRLTAVEPHTPAGRYDITLRDVEPATELHRMRIAARRAFAEGMALHEEGTRDAFLKAIGRFEDALTNWRGAHDPIEEARTLSSIGLMYIETGDQEQALKYMTGAVGVAQTSGDKKIEAHSLDFLAEVHNYFGDKRKAIDIYEQALPLLRDAGDRAFEGHTLNDLAVAYSGIGEKRKALSLFDQSIQIFTELQFRHMLAEVSGNLGMTFDYMGEYQRALENHQRELALLRELADHPNEAIVQNNIGSAYSGLGEFQKAFDAYTTALEINRSVDNRWNVAINLNNIAWVHGQVGDAQRALKVYQEALDIMRAVKDQRRIAVTVNNIAEIYAGIGDYRNAIALHNEALPLRKIVGDADGEGNTLNNLGKAYAKLGEREKAREYFERALSIHRSAGNPNMLARTLRSLGALDREAGEFQHATAHLEESLQLTRSIHDRRGEADGLFELARVERSRGNLTSAHAHADGALSAMETVRLAVASPTLRASFFASARDIQELDIDILMRLHAQQPDSGFGAISLLASERGKARSLLEMLGESGTEIRRGVDAALLDRERALGALIAAKAEQQTRLLNAKHSAADADAAEKEIDGLTAELEQVQSRIRTSSPQYAALMQPVPLDVKAIQKLLDPETVLLEYGLGADRSFLWAVTPTSLDIYNLPARAEIESATKRVHQLLTARNEKPAKETPVARTMRLRDADEAFRSAAAKVSNMLIGPAAARIANKRLLIAPEGVLQFLPFAALPDPAAAGKSPLISGHEVITVPSASLVDVLRRETEGREPAPKTLAVLADPVFSAVDARVAQADSRNNLTTKEVGEFLRLRFSRSEADEISRFVPAESTLKALDFDANRDTVLNGDLGQYRIVHFATHSLLNNEHPELSGVVLSLVDRAGRPQNGFLRLYDIYNLRLSSDLVVLSACETALGGEIKGEGLIGLTRGFLYAGAPRVVASLWEIDDRTTADLMKKFYEAMLVHRETPAAALRAAQVAILKTKGLESPYYWAAFTIQGEWR